MKRWGNITFLSLTTIAAFYLLIQTLGWLNVRISREIDDYWMREGELGLKIVAGEKGNPLPSRLLFAAFRVGLEPRKGPISHLLEIVEERGPGLPKQPEPAFGGLWKPVGVPGRTECFNGWVDALALGWKRKFAATAPEEKNAFQARLGQLFAAAGIEGGKFDSIKLSAEDTRGEARRKVAAFRVLAEGLNLQNAGNAGEE